MTEKPSEEECQQILQQKLADLTEDLGDEVSNFIATFSLDLPESPQIENVNNDVLREKAFAAATLEAVKKARVLMDQSNIKYERPPDNFVEMMKSEAQMDRIRRDIEEQEQKIIKTQAKNKQAKEIKQKPKDNVQKRPGVTLKPRKQNKKGKK